MAKILTPVGNAQIDTAQQKFGTGSGLFDGTDDNINTPNHADFDFGSGDFTIDFWVRRNTVGTQYICGQETVGGDDEHFIRFNSATNLIVWRWRDNSPSTNSVISTTGVTNDSTWHHIAVVRDTNTLDLFLDGALEGTADVTGKTQQTPTTPFAIGQAGDYTAGNFNGWVDEFRSSKGIARWTANFTPPTSAYNADNYSQTGLLIHFDGVDGSTAFIDDDNVIGGSSTQNALFFGGTNY